MADDTIGSIAGIGAVVANAYQQQGPYGGGVSLLRQYDVGGSYAYQEVLNVTGSGNVGIGTTSPSEKLHVFGGSVRVDGTNNPYIALNDGTYNGYIEAAGGVLRTNWNGFVGWAQTPTGNVGIGTVAPSGKLHVVGGPVWSLNGWNRAIVLDDGGAIEFGRGNANQFGMGVSVDKLYHWLSTSDDGMGFVQYYMVVDPNGNVGIGTDPGGNRLRVNGATRTTELGVDGNTTTGSLIVTGNVGIGTPSPGEKLTVAGVIETTGGIRFPDGTTQLSALPSGCGSGQVAKWNGSSWQCGNDSVGSGGVTSINGQAGPGITIQGGGATSVSTTNNTITVSSTAGITSVNGATGPSIAIQGGTGITVSTAGNTLTVSGVGVNTVAVCSDYRSSTAYCNYSGDCSPSEGSGRCSTVCGGLSRVRTAIASQSQCFVTSDTGNCNSFANCNIEESRCALCCVCAP